MKWKHKVCSASMTVNHTHESDLLSLFEHKIIENKIELNHALLGTTPIKHRRYRRGKGRCLCCGLKIGSKEHKPFEN